MTLTTLAFGILAAGAVLIVLRSVLGPTVGDRIVALDTLLLIVIGFVIVTAAAAGTDLFADVALVIALLAFVGTSIAARFIEQRGT